MAVSQRIDQNSSRNPRITFASGVATGAAVVAGIVVAASAITGVGERAELSASASNASITTVSMTDEQVFNVEQDFRSANGIGSEGGRTASMTDEQVFQAEQDYRSAHGVGSDEARTTSMTDEQVFQAEQDYRSANGITP